MPIRSLRHASRLTRPDLTPLAGVFLLLSFFFVLIYHTAEPRPGLVALHQTPRISCQSCFNAPDHTRLLVCLTTSGGLSFTASDARLQAVALKQASYHSNQQILTETQLLTCIKTAKTFSPSITKQPAYLYLVIDAEASSTIVMHLLHALQRHHFTRLNLVAHCRY